MTDVRVKRLRDKIATALETWSMHPGEAAKFRGEVYFALSTAYGGVGRAATLPLVQRQYRDTSHVIERGSELHHALLFFDALLLHLEA